MATHRSIPAILMLATCLAAYAQVAPPTLSLGDRIRYDADANPAVRPVDTATLPEGDPLRDAWQQFAAQQGGGWRVHVDQRSGVPTLAIGPGLAWFDPGAGRPSCAELELLAREFLAHHAALFALPVEQLVFEPGSCAPTTGGDLRVVFSQRHDGVRVEGASFVLDVVRGRLVSFGGSNLARVERAATSAMTADAARLVVLRYIGRGAESITLTAPPERRLVPIDARGEGRHAWTGPRGLGFTHRLAWHLEFKTPEDGMTWSATVDTDTATVVELRLVTRFGTTVGDVYPLTNDGIGWEGTRQSGFPMPFLYVWQNGLTSTSDRGGNVSCHDSGVPTHFYFDGPYWKIHDYCGASHETASCPVNLDLGGTSGTDCDVAPGHGTGDDNSSREAFYHLNRVAEKGRYYFPDQDWYSTQQVAWVNQTTMECNGYIDGDGLHYGVSAWWCRNFGENEAVVLHEWGHGVGYHDGYPEQDSPSEAESDAAPLIETRMSCIGRGAYDDNCSACSDDCVSCTGLRDHDWNAHASHTPWTWRNLCASGGGPCGKSDYDEGAILNQSLFDLATRDLRAMGLDSASAWQLLERLYYQSRRNSQGQAYNCDYGHSTDGCGANAWFHKFMVADDDDGNLANGTPHAAAIFAAFNRHEIACGSASDASNTNYTACPPVGRPEITVITKPDGAYVHWFGTSWATGYRVLVNDFGCDRAQTVVAEPTTPNWTDTTLTPNIRRYYSVQATGNANPKCESAVSNCTFAADDDDGDGWSAVQDCNDHDATVFPHNGELCDGKDNDCDGTIDEGLTQKTFYWDADLDGYGTTAKTISACAAPYHYSAYGTDCDDADPNTHPGATERCDAKDNRCIGAVGGDESDRDGDGWVQCAPYVGSKPGISGGGDCDDMDSLTHPGATELCDGTDNDCNGTVPANEHDGDGDGYVSCSPWDDYHEAFPYIVGGGDCNDLSASVHPGATEICDALDDDCNGALPSNEQDHDGDRYLACEPYVGRIGTILGGGDCNEFNAAIHPNALESCDHVDNDCDGQVDEASPQVPFSIDVAGSVDFGRAVATLGDVNGDGTPDFAVGEPRYALNAGAVVVHSGATRAVICQTPTGPSASRLGTTVTRLSDIDADGIRDFAAGAPTYDTPMGAIDAGAVMIYSGADCHLIRTCTPGAAGNEVGAGQGLAAYGVSVLAGAPYRANGSIGGAGAVFMINSRTCAVTLTMTDAQAVANDHLGLAVAMIGDVNGDGTSDIAASAPDYDARGTDRGEVLLFSGANGAFIAYVRTDAPTEGGRFGTSIAAVGDLDGDGKGELIVGEPGANTGSGTLTGRVTIWSPENQYQLRRIDGTVAQDQLGSSVAAVADRDGDGSADVAAGAPLDDAGGLTDAGRVEIYSGASGALIRTLQGSPDANAKLGTAVADLGDVTGDGLPEVLAGAPGQNLAVVLGTESDCDADTYPRDGGDCNDFNASVHPGALELCNGTDDDCDGTIDEGASAPGYAGGLVFGIDHQTLSWPQQSGAESYDVVKGDLVLQQNGGNFTPTVLACLANDTTSTSASDGGRPRNGKGTWFLYRANGCGGQAGTYDEQGGGQQGARDAEINASANACP